MPRAFSYGNRHTLVLLDRFGRIRDFYYPYVGLENHVSGKLAHNIGVFVEGQFAWTHSGEWNITRSVNVGWTGTIRMEHPRLRVVLTLEDTLYHEKDIFLRRLTVENLEASDRSIKVFFNQQFERHGVL
jgi:GH15 family glucan-1,4-alpha-glucosidase